MLRYRLVVQLITTTRVMAALSFASVALIPAAHSMAVVLYAGALATDFIDGAIARRFHSCTMFGEHYDGFADKTVSIVSVIYNAVLGGPILACSLIISRDALALTVRAATANRHRGSRLIGAITGAPIRVITLTELVYPHLASDLYVIAVWVAAAVSVASALLEIWIHKTELSLLLSGVNR